MEEAQLTVWGTGAEEMYTSTICLLPYCLVWRIGSWGVDSFMEGHYFSSHLTRSHPLGVSLAAWMRSEDWSSKNLQAPHRHSCMCAHMPFHHFHFNSLSRLSKKRGPFLSFLYPGFFLSKSPEKSTCLNFSHHLFHSKICIYSPYFEPVPSFPFLLVFLQDLIYCLLYALSSTHGHVCT